MIAIVAYFHNTHVPKTEDGKSDLMKFYARSTDRKNKTDWQPLAEHLKNVGKRAGAFASYFSGGVSLLAEEAGLLHDIGKYTREFQGRLLGEYPRVDHSTRGAKLALERYGPVGYLLAYAIAGHHAGLANGKGTGKRTSLQDRLQKNLPKLLDSWEDEIAPASPCTIVAPKAFRSKREQENFQYAFLIRMIFSCLVDADFLDTENFFARIKGKPITRDFDGVSLQDLGSRLDRHLQRFDAHNADTNVDSERHKNILGWRSEILASVRKKADFEPGLFSLTVPTGGGKTLTSLAFALDHAIRHNLRRIIYVIPFTSIIDQNATVFREALGDLGHVVLEHHSAFVEKTPNKRTPDEYQSRTKLSLAMENWDAPIVVTTAVQFFESLFANRPSKCRKLHNIASSVIILDEAQTIPLSVLRPCMAALDELASNYCTSIVLCTATQPALTAPNFADGFENVRELAPEPEMMFERFKRVHVTHRGLLRDDQLIQEIVSREQVLCIVNNRRHARSLFNSIKEQSSAYHLTTSMCAKHRIDVLEKIREDLKNGRPCRLIATSLIEAGVDVDFATVLRAEAGLDSIAQAAGRCNREGRRSVSDSEVLVFVSDDQWPPPPELTQLAQVSREVFRQFPRDPMSLEAIESYFNHLYWQKGSRELDAKALMTLMRESCIDSFPFEELAAKFRMIENAQCPIIINYREEASETLERLKYAEGCVGLARLLQPYTVQVPQRAHDALYRSGAIQPVAPEKFGEQFVTLINRDLYNEDCGLCWDDPTFMSAESSIV